MVLFKIVILQNNPKSIEKDHVGVSFLITLLAENLQFYQKGEFSTGVFLRQIFKTTFFIEYLRRLLLYCGNSK